MLSRSTIVDLLPCMQNINYILYNYYWHTDRLASPTEPPGTDHTGEIISFSDVGSGVGTNPRAWYCYTSNPGGVVWQFPNGSDVPIVTDKNAVGDDLFISGIYHTAVVLHRGSTHFSPDGEHCCVRTSHGPAQRLCVTFSER